MLICALFPNKHFNYFIGNTKQTKEYIQCTLTDTENNAEIVLKCINAIHIIY